MPWLEVPDWRAWQPYAVPMSDPDVTPTAVHEELMELPETPEAEVIPFPDELPGAKVVITGSIDVHLDGEDSFGPGVAELVGSEPERIDVPTLLPPPAPASTHERPTETEAERARRLEKESMSRSERLRRGW